MPRMEAATPGALPLLSALWPLPRYPDFKVPHDTDFGKGYRRQLIPPGTYGIVQDYISNHAVVVRDPTFDYHKDLHKHYLHFSPNHLVSEAQDAIESAKAEAKANAKAAATAAEQEALDLLPWNGSKHTRKDLEKRLPLGAKVRRATQCTGESIFENGKFIMQPGMLGVVKVYKDPITDEACLSFTYYCAVVEHEGLLGPTSTSYHLLTLELVPAEAGADV